MSLVQLFLLPFGRSGWEVGCGEVMGCEQSWQRELGVECIMNKINLFKNMQKLTRKDNDNAETLSFCLLSRFYDKVL